LTKAPVKRCSIRSEARAAYGSRQILSLAFDNAARDL